jgi:L-ascorbate metabolism protein UlaG (beta-lactamase superfamily)
MLNRRSFLGTLGTSLIGTATLAAQETTRRRSRWEMVAADDPVAAPDAKPDPRSWDDGTITASWIGHATVLVNFFGVKFITDPVFSTRIGLNVGGLFTIGPRRLVYPALEIDHLPDLDFILLSHAHMDHCDLPSLDRFKRTVPLIIAQNTYDVTEALEFEKVYMLDWGKWTEVAGVHIEALEVKHFGWRYPWEQDRSRGYWNGRSFNAYILTRNGRSIVFGGDTAYHEKFRALKDRPTPIDLAIMPIGAYDPWIHNHATPEQALAMCDHMGAHHMLPIHWKTFIQSEEPTQEPIARLRAAASGTPDRIALEGVGQTWALGVARDEAPRNPAARTAPATAPTTSAGADSSSTD